MPNYFFFINQLLIVLLGTKKTPSSKVITSELSLDLQDTRYASSGIAKTSSIEHKQEQDDEEESEISWTASSYKDL